MGHHVRQVIAEMSGRLIVSLPLMVKRIKEQ